MAVAASLARFWSRTEFRCETVAAALALIAVIALSALALVDPALAGRLTVENGVVEWIQVLLEAAAAVLFARHLARDASRVGRVSPLDVVIVASLVGLVIGEVDLDRLIFGTKIIATKFFVDARVAFGWRLLAMLVVVGVPLAIGVFALVRIRAFWRDGWAAIASRGARARGERGSGGVDRALRETARPRAGCPRYFLEELLELVAAIGFLVSALSRRSDPTADPLKAAYSTTLIRQ
jgi:hypothetical protein